MKLFSFYQPRDRIIVSIFQGENIIIGVSKGQQADSNWQSVRLLTTFIIQLFANFNQSVF